MLDCRCYPRPIIPRARLNKARSLHYHKIVQNEIAVSTQHQSCCGAHTDLDPRATLKSGFPLFLLPLATAIRSGPSSCSSSPSHLVCPRIVSTGTSLTVTRSSACSRWALVHLDSPSQRDPPQVRRRCRHFSNTDLRRMDIRYLDR